MVLKKIALTGASGMLGRHMLSLLKDKNIFCHSSSRTQPKDLDSNEYLSWRKWDLQDRKSIKDLDDIFPEVDGVIHIGAIVPNKRNEFSDESIIKSNVDATFDIACWARDKKIQMIFISGSTVYQDTLADNIKEDDLKTKGNSTGGKYGESKWLAEEAISSLVDNGLRLTILRPSSIYGTGLGENKMVIKFINDAIKNKLIKLDPPYNNKVNLIHASDVAEASLACLIKNIPGVFNIGGDQEYSIREISALIAEQVNGTVVEVSVDDTNDGAALFSLDTNKARNAFNFAAKVYLREGIKKIIQGTF